jgi:hypothetical protein
MAKATVKAPVGYHFMVDSIGAFYLMKTSSMGYVEHTEDNYTSSLSVSLEVMGTHSQTTTTQTTATATSSSGATTTSRTISPTNTTSTSTGGGY